MPGKQGGTQKPNEMLKRKNKDYDDVKFWDQDDKAFLQKKKEEDAKMKAMKDKLSKKKWCIYTYNFFNENLYSLRWNDLVEVLLYKYWKNKLNHLEKQANAAEDQFQHQSKSNSYIYVYKIRK